ncbi:MAG: helix-turn-helix domain-containing protein [Defluviitaleaceae bacterium]|nr:helix-turn-helix domain-containing protein [Defluviitaleaceae bacterium]
MPDEILTIHEAAKYLKISGKTIRRLISNKLLVASKVGNTWRIRKSDIDSYLIENNNKQEVNFSGS